MSGKQFVKQLLPPILLTAQRALMAGKKLSPAQVKARMILKAEHDRWNQGLEADEICLRPGLTLKLHPESREPFEAFCFAYPEMVEEMESFLQHTQGRRNLLDVGALHGIFSLTFAAADPSRHAVAVDASPLAFARLLYNVHKNKLANVTPIECALSDGIGTIRMHYEWEHAVATGTEEGRDGGLTVEKQTGDALCESLGFSPDVIKVDVEGHEVKVLAGLRETIRRCNPLVFLEFHPGRIREEGECLESVGRFFADLGYRAETTTGESVPLEQIAASEGDRRFLLRPDGEGDAPRD